MRSGNRRFAGGRPQGCRRRLFSLAAITAAQLLISSVPAHGATVSVVTLPGASIYDEVVYVAASGERNEVVVRQLGVASERFSLSVAVSDAGALITPGDSCMAIDEHMVRCAPRPSEPLFTSGGVGQIRVDLGDLDDRFDAPDPGFYTGVSTFVDGGPGNDLLAGGPDIDELQGGLGDDSVSGNRGGDHLAGGAGNDRLFGGDGYDSLDGGGGRDQLYGEGDDDVLSDGDRDGAPGEAGPGPDVLDGGAGTPCCPLPEDAKTLGKDTISYEKRTAPVAVDLLDPRTDGEADEGDVLSGVESVIGGRGEDRLAGDDDRNSLVGGGGRDLLIGRGGDDVLDGGTGPDRLIGNSGDDEFTSARRVLCDGGRDTVNGGISGHDFLPPDCEKLFVARPYPFLAMELDAYPAFVRSRSVGYLIRCDWVDSEEELPGPQREEVCSGTLRVQRASAPRLLLAHGTFPRGRWRDRLVKARITTLGSRLASRRHGVRATVTIAGHNLDPPIRWTIRLKVPRRRETSTYKVARRGAFSAFLAPTADDPTASSLNRNSSTAGHRSRGHLREPGRTRRRAPRARLRPHASGRVPVRSAPAADEPRVSEGYVRTLLLRPGRSERLREFDPRAWRSSKASGAGSAARALARRTPRRRPRSGPRRAVGPSNARPARRPRRGRRAARAARRPFARSRLRPRRAGRA